MQKENLQERDMGRTCTRKYIAQGELRGIFIALFFLTISMQAQICVQGKEYIIKTPTLQNLGFEWYIDGDDNRIAGVNVNDYEVFEILHKPIHTSVRGLTSLVYHAADLNLHGKAVDIGIKISSANDNYQGSIPDLGALEVEGPVVIYGACGLDLNQEFYR